MKEIHVCGSEMYESDETRADATEELIEGALQTQTLIGDTATAAFLLEKGVNIRTIARVLLDPLQRRTKSRRIKLRWHIAG